jgi:serine protease Do
MRDGKERTMTVTVDELDLEAEQGRQGRGQPDEPGERGGDSFGLTLGNLTPQRERQLDLPAGTTGALVMEVDPNGPSANFLQPGDVIISINRQSVSSAAEAGRALQQIPTGRIAQIRVWRDGRVLFFPLRKE